MMHQNNFDPNMASSVTLACCQSLCDVLTELPLPTAVVDKTAHTRTLIAGGLSAANRPPVLSDLSIIPHLQQSLYIAKQQLSEIDFLPATSNPTSDSPFGQAAANSAENASSTPHPLPPSQLLLALSAQEFFCTPPLAPTTTPFSQQQQTQAHHLPTNNGGNNVAGASNADSLADSLADLHADLQTIEPSIDKHMDEFHQNLMNDLMNDDCDMSSSMTNSNSNDLSNFSTPHLPVQQSQQQPQQQHTHPPNHSVDSAAPLHPHPPLPMLNNNDFNLHNHFPNAIPAEFDDKADAEFDANYSSLGERVKSRQREAAQRASLATSAAFISQSAAASAAANSSIVAPNSLQQTNSMFNSNVQVNNSVPEVVPPIANHHNHVKPPVVPKAEPVARTDSTEDKDWQLPPAKKTRSESSATTTPAVRRQSLPQPPQPPRRSYADVKPQQIRSVKYSFVDLDSDSMLLNSSVDIAVRFEQIIDEILSTSCNDFNDYEEDDDETDTEDGYAYGQQRRGHGHSSKKKKKHSKASHEANHVNGMSFDVTIDAEQLKEIMILSAKLKQTNRVVDIERKKIILFLTVLSNQLNIWFTRYKSKAPSHNPEEEDYEEADEREHYWELCCNASQSALHIMTSSSPTNDKASLISLEELIEVIVDFLSNNLSSTTHVTKGKSPGKGRNSASASHFGVSKRHVTRWTQLLQLLFEFINLRQKGSLTDTLILSLTRVSMSSLFLLQNTAEMQFVSIELMCHIFEEYNRHRASIIEELLNSLSKIPTKKSHRKDSVLTQMLLRLTGAFFHPDLEKPFKASAPRYTRETLSAQNTTAMQIISGFISHFIRKCYTSSSNSEVDFKLIFESLLNDLLESLHSPHSTASILIVQIIAKLLISFLQPSAAKAQATSLAARNLAIEYLAIICSKFAQLFAEKEETMKELAKTLSTIEESEKTPTKKGKRKDRKKGKKEKEVKEEEVEEAEPTVTEPTGNINTPANIRKVWNLLVDYFNSEKLYREKLVLASIWMRDKYYSENEQLEKEFLLRLNTDKPQNEESNEASVVDISTAALCIQYMEFAHFSATLRVFEFSISHVTLSLSNTTNTTQRSKAMKCLSSILSASSIERASQLLARADLQKAMSTALLDPSTSVREATVDLIGRFVLQSKDQKLCQRYCDLIGERILDAGISVRKRVIKILRDFCIEFPEFEKCGEIAARIVRRINDDGEGIRRLVVETCRDLWFSSTNPSPIKFRVYSLLHVIATMLNDNANLESMQSLFDQLIKAETMPVAQEICDCIMSDILIDDLAQAKKITQLSAIQCVAMMAQCCPQLMVKHIDTLQSFMSLSCETLIEISLRVKVITTLERVLPHIKNPSPHLLTRLEEDLIRNVLQSGINILGGSVKCLSILIKKHTKNTKLAVESFVKFQQILYDYRNRLYEGLMKEEQVKPKLLRAIYTCGLFAKYFSHDILEYRDRLRDTLIELIQSPYSVDIKCKSIMSLGFFIESEPRICLHPAVVDIYTKVLRNQFSADADPLVNKKNDELFCVQVLNNFRNYLSESIESDENAVKTIEWSQESLKSMQSAEDDSASAQSQIIQKYLGSILVNGLNPNLTIRRVACNVIHVIHSGGHVHPLQLVSHLVAMTADDDTQIRMRADHVLHEIERKYHGFVGMKAKEGIYLSAIFCSRLKSPGYRIYMAKNTATTTSDGTTAVQSASTKEICARLTTLYQVICNNRQSRRGFVTSLLRNLDSTELSMKADTQAATFDGAPTNTTSAANREMIDLGWVVENVLTFPYTVYDEILFILNQLECTSSLNSTHITQLFKEIFTIERPPAGVPEQTPDQPMDGVNEYGAYPPSALANNLTEHFDLEDLDLDNEEHLRKFAKNIHVNFDLLLLDTRNERLTNLVRSLRAMYLSTLLRTLLKEFYLLKDEKINDYSTNDTKTWERPVHRRQIESRHLKDLLTAAEPCLSFPESLLLCEDLSGLEKQLLDEWKRFKYVSLNNCDPNLKATSISKLFQVKNE